MLRHALASTVSPRRLRRLRRRGSELVEFAIVFPFFMLMFTAIMEFSWYFYQRSVVMNAARLGCEAGGQANPQQDDVPAIVTAVVADALAGQAGIDCGDGVYNCQLTVNMFGLVGNDIPRVQCYVRTNFRSLTGFLGDYNDDVGSGTQYFRDNWGWEHDGRILPQFIEGRSVSVFEEAD